MEDGFAQRARRRAVRGASPGRPGDLAADAGAVGVQRPAGMADGPHSLRRHRVRPQLLHGLQLVEAGVPFVEVGQDNYDSHADNFVCHKANMDGARSRLVGLARGSARARPACNDTLVVWMGEVGPDAVHQQPRRPRPLHPRLDDRAGRRRHPRRPGLRRHRRRRPGGDGQPGVAKATCSRRSTPCSASTRASGITSAPGRSGRRRRDRAAVRELIG